MHCIALALYLFNDSHDDGAPYLSNGTERTLIKTRNVLSPSVVYVHFSHFNFLQLIRCTSSKLGDDMFSESVVFQL